MDVHQLLLDRHGSGGAEAEYPAWIRPYTAPLTRSLGATFSKMIPSRSAGALNPTEHFQNEDSATWWTPWGLFSVQDSPISSPADVAGYGLPRAQGGPEGAPVLSSGPPGIAGEPTRPAIGTAYKTPSSLWNLACIATGWSRPLQATPGRQPTAKMAVGKWTPFGGGSAPLPSVPAPGRMVAPLL